VHQVIFIKLAYDFTHNLVAKPDAISAFKP
jgi:hypothetical protein